MQLLETHGVVGIPPIIATGIWPGRRQLPFYVIPWYERGSLQHLVDTDELELTDRVDLLIRIAQVLSGVHAVEVAHRDLKPDNVLIGADGSPFLADFGLCLPLDAESRLTEEWRGVGPRLYLAPEMEVGANPDADHRPADFWSFAKVMWVVVSGRSPLSSADQLNAEHRLGMIRSALSGLDSLGEKMLERKPQDRLGDWAVVEAELRAARTELDGPSVVPSPARGQPGAALRAVARFVASPTAVRERDERARQEHRAQQLGEFGSIANIDAVAAGRQLIDGLNDQLGGHYFSIGSGGPTLAVIARTGIFDPVLSGSPRGSEHAVVIWNGQIPGTDLAVQVGMWLLLVDSKIHPARVAYLWDGNRQQVRTPGDVLAEYGKLHDPVHLGLASARDAIVLAARELIDCADEFTARVFGIVQAGDALTDGDAWRRY